MKILISIHVILLWTILEGQSWAISDYCQNQHRLRIQRCDRDYSLQRASCERKAILGKKRCQKILRRKQIRCHRFSRRQSLKSCQLSTLDANQKRICQQKSQHLLDKCKDMEKRRQRCNEASQICQKACSIDKIVSCVKACRDKQVRCLYAIEDAKTQCHWQALKAERLCKRSLEDERLKKIYDCLYQKEMKLRACRRKIEDDNINCLYENFRSKMKCLRNASSQRRTCYMNSLAKLRACK